MPIHDRHERPAQRPALGPPRLSVHHEKRRTRVGLPTREALALIAAQHELEAALDEAVPNARRVAAARRRLARADEAWAESSAGGW